MMSWVRISILVALLAAMPAPSSGAEESDPYPIWWSPKLELESLDRIDERLERKLWPDRTGIEVYKEEGGRKLYATMGNCASVLALRKQGYWGKGNSGHQVVLYLVAECRAIEILKQARPADTSYVRGFVFDHDAPNYLPAMLHYGPSCELLCRQFKENDNRIPLAQEMDIIRVDIKNMLKIKLFSEWWYVGVELLARGEFNGDDLEDILVLATNGATQGTYGGTHLFMLTRESAEDVLWIVNAHRYLCVDYTC